jgi:hypothetical protein
VKVKNLFDRADDTVKVQIGNVPVKLASGQEAIVGTSTYALQQALRKDNLGRRNVKDFQAAGMCAARTEFSLVSLMRKDSLTHVLVQSKDKEHNQLTEGLIKAAACLMVATQGHGIYKAAN